jgi:hypothetical protein
MPGKPLQESVAWYGSIVTDTQQELRQAFEDLKPNPAKPEPNRISDMMPEWALNS